MMVAFGGTVKVRSVVASLAVALLLAPGCHQEEEAPTSPPASPLPTADSGRPVQPKPPRADQGGETNKIGSVGRDLDKDLASSPIAPDGPTTHAPPAAKPDSAQTDATKSGQP
jgi:hypothetical protein